MIPYQPSTLAALTTPIDALVDPLRQLTTRLGLSHAAIGLQLDEAMQPATYASSVEFRFSLFALLQRLLPEANYRSCDHALEQMQARKTAKELECIQRASEIAAAGFARAAEVVQVGRREDRNRGCPAGRFPGFDKSCGGRTQLRLLFLYVWARTLPVPLPLTHALDSAQSRPAIW